MINKNIKTPDIQICPNCGRAISVAPISPKLKNKKRRNPYKTDTPGCF